VTLHRNAKTCRLSCWVFMIHAQKRGHARAHPTASTRENTPLCDHTMAATRGRRWRLATAATRVATWRRGGSGAATRSMGAPARRGRGRRAWATRIVNGERARSLDLGGGSRLTAGGACPEIWGRLLKQKMTNHTRSRPSAPRWKGKPHSRFTRRREPTARWLRQAFPGPCGGRRRKLFGRALRVCRPRLS